MRKLNNDNDPLGEKTFQFALRIVKLNQFLVENKKEFILSKQVLRSGTNPGAMIREAQHAESGFDFIHKLAVARKEMNETLYWIELLNAAKYINQLEFKSLYADGQEIMKLLTSSIRTKKNNLKTQKK